MKKLFAVIIFIFLAGCGAFSKTAPVPEKIEMLFFYDNSCGSCNGTEEFYNIFNGQLSKEEKDKYEYTLTDFNVFQSGGREHYDKVMKEKGIDTAGLAFPLLLVNNKVFTGMDNIETNIKEAFLTAGEDIFVNGYVYSPLNPNADRPEKRFKIDKQNASVIYFYRITCEECGQTKPFIDSLPETGVDVVRINTRSGNNGELLRTFFDKYAVPDEDQMVPIVFLRDEYLAGYENISGELPALLESGAGQDFSFPD